MTHAIDLSMTAWRKVHGQITAYGTWVQMSGAWRPALVLVRTGDETSDHCVPCIVTMDRIWVVTEEVGNEIQAGRLVASFLDPLRLGPSARNSIKLLSIIRDHIGDVLSIGPRPSKGLRTVVGEAIMTNHSTGKVTETEIVENA
ncbi:hypothetical protein DBT53_004465 [Aerococcus mictus]|uniref:hypothetical protein n=1 Tax=Aerococcus mictus TaxID=2976810 RepID=UPI000DCEF001|nr:hypothetical protein DBT53_10240 [Aerococcus mictus]RAW03646.1 hypothetical protein DBT41_11890 [Aerococcus urinae]